MRSISMLLGPAANRVCSSWRSTAQRVIYALAGLAAIGAFGGATTATAQTPMVQSFVTSKGVQLYDLTYILSDGSLHLFDGTPTVIPDGPVGVVVFSPNIGDTTLIGQSFESVFGTGTDLSDLLESYDGDVDTTNTTGSLITTLQSSYAITVPNGQSQAVQGVLFSNGQDIGTIILDPPYTVSVFGLASEVPEPGLIAALAALGLGGVWQATLLRRKRTTRR